SAAILPCHRQYGETECRAGIAQDLLQPAPPTSVAEFAGYHSSAQKSLPYPVPTNRRSLYSASAELRCRVAASAIRRTRGRTRSERLRPAHPAWSDRRPEPIRTGTARCYRI